MKRFLKRPKCLFEVIEDFHVMLYHDRYYFQRNTTEMYQEELLLIQFLVLHEVYKLSTLNQAADRY